MLKVVLEINHGPNGISFTIGGSSQADFETATDLEKLVGIMAKNGIKTVTAHTHQIVNGMISGKIGNDEAVGKLLYRLGRSMQKIADEAERYAKATGPERVDQSKPGS